VSDDLRQRLAAVLLRRLAPSADLAATLDDLIRIEGAELERLRELRAALGGPEADRG